VLVLARRVHVEHRAHGHICAAPGSSGVHVTAWQSAARGGEQARATPRARAYRPCFVASRRHRRHRLSVRASDVHTFGALSSDGDGDGNCGCGSNSDANDSAQQPWLGVKAASSDGTAARRDGAAVVAAAARDWRAPRSASCSAPETRERHAAVCGRVALGQRLSPR
jgi:hypothetical protein